MRVAVVSSDNTRSTLFGFFDDVARAEFAEFFTILTKRLSVATAIQFLSVSTKGAVDVGLKDKKGGKEGRGEREVKVIPTGSLRMNPFLNTT